MTAGDLGPEAHPPPQVDVIVPYWNAERTIGRALASIVNAADHATVSIVVVDDGSASESATQLGRIARDVPGCRVVRIPHGGVAAARNAGLAETASNLVSFCDADDEWLPGRLEAQIAVLDADPSLTYVAGRLQIAVEDGYARPKWCRPEWLDGPQPGNLLGALLVRRSLFARIGTFDATLVHGADDVDWFARVRHAGAPSAPIDRVVLRRWIHDTNISHDTRGLGELLDVVRRHAARTGGRQT